MDLPLEDEPIWYLKTSKDIERRQRAERAVKRLQKLAAHA